MIYQLTKKWRSLLLVAGAAAGVVADVTFMAQDTIDLQNSARKIMLDGFLLEWNTQAARPWGSDTCWQWNAMVTPEGPSGYLVSSLDVVRQGWSVTFSGPLLPVPIEITLPQDTARKDDRFKIDVTQTDSNGVCVVEWLFPWPEQSDDLAKPVVVTFHAAADSGKMLPDVVVRCKKVSKRTKVWSGVTGRGILIGLLALLYLFVQRKLKRQTVRKESPRQSA